MTTKGREQSRPFFFVAHAFHIPGVIVRLVRNCALGRTIQYSRDGSD